MKTNTHFNFDDVKVKENKNVHEIATNLKHTNLSSSLRRQVPVLSSYLVTNIYKQLIRL